jgi:hypothetical protein
LLLGLLFGLGMAIYQIVRVSTVTGSSLGSILNSLDGAQGTVVGSMILQGAIYTLYAVLAGATIGVLLTVPDKALKGAIVGVLFGAIVGAIFKWLLSEIGIVLNPTLFRILTGALIFGLLTAIVSRA